MIPVFVLSVAAVMILFEVVRGGRKWPQVRGWWGRAFLLNGVQFLVAYVAVLAWDPWMAQYRLFSVDALGTTGGAIVGYIAITFVFYWWHRARHQLPFLWRWFHQVHHSPRRIEIITSFYKHPFEIFVNSLMSTAIVYFLVGLNPLTAGYALLLTGLAELFYHWNVKTPHWIGPFFQRPEMHCVHHQTRLHHYNYADLPIWDILFGTYRNPRKWDAQCGFDESSELKLGKMLRGEVVE